MARFIFRFAAITVFVCTVMFVGLFPALTDSSQKGATPDFSYRSQTSTHKVIVYAHEEELRNKILAEGGSVIEDYGGFWLLDAPTDTADQVSAQSSSPSMVRDDMNLLLLRAGVFDTTEGEPLSMRALGESDPSGEQLQLVQMVGPVKQEWFDQLQEIAEIITYIPNNAYLVRADPAAMGRINSSGFIQWTGEFRPAYKIAPEISLDTDQEIMATVQLVTSQDVEAAVQAIASLSTEPILDEPTSVLNFTNVRIKAHPARLAEIARRNDVIWIEPWSAPEMFDERQDLIVAGLITGNQLGAPNYLSWLSSKRLASTPDFIVDISDSGIDKGILDPAVIHPDFLSTAGLSRVIYARTVSDSVIDGAPNDTGGHGTINAAIVGGFNAHPNFPYTDAEGYSFGLGVHPFAKMGVTKIFNPEFTNPSYQSMVEMMYRDGARISSSSWGAYNNSYNADCQLYDSLVRDSSPAESGNQEMTVVFASGNGGQNRLSTPGNAKNVITVGASENIRPGFDGCRISSEGADDAQSIIHFSSRGLTTDGRVKPEIAAPGTHIQGAASQDRSYTGASICGPRNYPDGQVMYTWSSGTSHSTPAIAGAAALVRQFFQQSTGRPASPAMIKAFLTNSTTYMTGNLAGGDLPGTGQGWGLANIGRALDEVPRIMIDQNQILSSTGGTITVRGRIADPTKPLRVTLAWTDAPGNPAANPVVNDLDLQVDAGGKTYLGNRFNGSVSTDGGSPDKLNNIEAVWTPDGTSGDFVVRIVAANIAGDGVPGNGDITDQDFALVIYNARAPGDGGGGGGQIDSPPVVNLKYPVGGEKVLVGNLIRILWDASDDKKIESQRVEFSSDRGVTFSTIATLNGNARSFDWKIPSVPTQSARIRITALDGVNLPSSSTSPNDFEVIAGPPDTTPPTVTLLSPTNNSVVAGGLPNLIKWREADNVGVIRRVLELSTDAGNTFQQIASIEAPSSGEQQSFEWQVPAALSVSRGRVRITVYDGANNSASFESSGKFDVWPLPIITGADYDKNTGKGQFEVFGRKFRIGDTEIYVNDRKLKKIRFNNRCDEPDGTCNKVSSVDKKINKFVPEGRFVDIVIKISSTGQTSPAFRWKRKPGQE